MYALGVLLDIPAYSSTHLFTSLPSVLRRPGFRATSDRAINVLVSEINRVEPAVCTMDIEAIRFCLIPVLGTMVCLEGSNTPEIRGETTISTIEVAQFC